jgi:hypothetical protein
MRKKIHFSYAERNDKIMSPPENHRTRFEGYNDDSADLIPFARFLVVDSLVIVCDRYGAFPVSTATVSRRV